MKKAILISILILNTCFCYSYSPSEIAETIETINPDYIYYSAEIDSIASSVLEKNPIGSSADELTNYNLKYLSALDNRDGEKEKAVSLLKECLEYYKTKNKEKQALYCYYHIINFKKIFKEISEAELYFDESKRVHFEDGEDHEIKVLRAFILLKIGIMRNIHNSDAANIKVLTKAGNDLRELNSIRGFIDAQNSIAINYNNRGFYKTAEDIYIEALDFLDNLESDYDPHHNKIKLLINLANTYEKQGKYADALKINLGQLEYCSEYYNKNLSEYDSYSSYLLSNVGNIYYSIEDYSKALDYYQATIDSEFKKKRPDTKLVTYQYLAIGKIKLEQQKYEEAEEFFQKALTLSIDDERTIEHSRAIFYLGKIKYENKKWEEAELLFNQSLKIKSDNGITTSSTYSNLGEIAFKNKQYEKSLDLCLKGINTLEITSQVDLKPCYECVIKNYLYKGDYQNATAYQEGLIKIFTEQQEKSDFISIARQEVNQRLLRDSLTIQDYTLSNVEQELIISKTRSANLLLTIALVFFGMLLSALAYFYIKRRKYLDQINSLNQDLLVSNSTLKSLNLELESTNTNLDKSNHRLLVANESLENFASIAAHDIKAPLRTIKSFSKLIEKKYSDTLKEDEFFSYILNSVKTLDQLVDDLLDFARLNKNLTPPVEININEVIETVESSLDHSIKSNNVKITSTKVPVLIKAHHSLIYQIFLNTINNSIKFSIPDITPIINIDFEIDAESNLIVKIQDNGIGIKQEFLDKIFQPFKKLHASSVYEGSGIGLASCKKAIEQYGGTIWAKSIVGQGTSIFFKIPADKIISR